MKVTDYHSSPALRDFVLGYKLIESQDGIVNQLLPDTSLAIAFRLQGHVSQISNGKMNPLPLASVSGLRNSMREIQYEKHTRTLVALLSPIGASQLLAEPLHHLYNQTVALDDVSTTNTAPLLDKLMSAPAVNEQVAFVDHHLETMVSAHLRNAAPRRTLRPNGFHPNQKVPGTFPSDAVIERAVMVISDSKGLVRMHVLCEHLCLSQDAFEKRFRKVVGSTPKQFANIVRMRSIIDHKSPDLMEIAYEHEFYDQAHFSKSFKQFTGKNPTEFFKKPDFW